MRLPKKVELAVLTATAAALTLAAPTPANAASPATQGLAASQLAAGPYCPERAIFMGTWYMSYIGVNGHHYDLYRGLPLSPFGHGIVDCDS